jgi:uncharacterized protein (DUF1800 family)
MTMSRFLAGAISAAGLACLLAACAESPPRAAHDGAAAPTGADTVARLDRITWGADGTDLRAVSQAGWNAWLERQLHPGPTVLPAEVQAQIDAMGIARQPLAALAQDMEQRRKSADAVEGVEEKKAAQKDYQTAMNTLAREAALRSLMRDLYSNNQLQEQMTWFWMNHFNVHSGKANLRALVGDYEETAVRPHALGKFRDLLTAVLRHPAMIRYLDNEQNAVNRINENYARELMELHTLGVDGGYSQRDVQELARILTGVGVDLRPATDAPPKIKPELRDQYVHDGLFEFNPNRHDYGPKQFLGQPMHARGLAEVDEAIARLCRQPATAHFVSLKLAMYFDADAPPPALVARMAQTFTKTDGDIAATLKTLFESPEFAASLDRKFKDPVHYAVSAVRQAYDGQVILNAAPLMGWINRMGEPLYGRQTPDGYPLTQSAWASPGQMSTRFEIAKTIGSGNGGLFRTEGAQPVERPGFPQLANAVFYGYRQQALSPSTRTALQQATSPQEWNAYFLSSPEMMNR